MFFYPACLPGSFRHIFRGANSSCLCRWCPHLLLASRQPSAGQRKTPISFFYLNPPSRWPGPTSHGWRCTVGNSRLSSWVSMFQRTSQMKSYLAEAENIATHLFFLASVWMSVRPGCNGAFWRMCVQQEVRRADKVQTRKKIWIKHSMLPIMRLAHNMCHRILFVERTWARQFTVDEKRPINLISTIKFLITHWKI